ncbi:hypothetical protein [Sphingobacterium sp. WOUb80]|uniref:hypothetical protein n=1 Tax=Sphingobacterium sp. WOUb80 TaxID=3234028 RepID=UPI003CE8A4DE
MEKFKNFAKVLLGVALLGTGAGAATYAQAQKQTVKTNLTTRYWINTGSQYQETNSIPDPQNHCSDPSDYQCVLQSDDPSVDSTFPLDDAENQNVSPHPDSELGQYTP